MVDKSAPEEIGRDECVRLLSSAQIGRVVFTERALPAIQPVNYVVHRDTIVMAVLAGSKLVAAASDTVLGFQVDDIDPERRSGWSVTAVGRSRVVRDPLEVSALSGLPLVPWVLGRRIQFIELELELVHGRRLLARLGEPLAPVVAVGNEPVGTIG